jgi:DMSO/TMAO reductase YedYZ molybdopterin-dependent catalytic subunit
MKGRWNRREWLAFATVPAAAQQKKLLLPSDVPDQHHLRLMWYHPVPPIDAASWRLEVTGLAEKPGKFTVADLRRLPQVSQSSRMKCVQCWSARAKWGGFRFASLLDLVKPRKTARAIRIDCADQWYEYMSLDEMRQPSVLMTMDLNGQPLTPDHGAPLRLLDPSKYGYKSAKLITRITFVEEGKGSMACDIGPYYSPTGDILPGYDTPLDLDGGKKKRRIAGGEITEY